MEGVLSTNTKFENEELASSHTRLAHHRKYVYERIVFAVVVGKTCSSRNIMKILESRR